MANNIIIGVGMTTDDAKKKTRELDTELEKLGKTGEKTGEGFKVANLSLTDLKSGIDLANQAVGLAGQIWDATGGKALEYSDQVRDLGRISGASAEDTSRLIQVADDLQVSFDTLKRASKNAADEGISLTVESMAALQKEYQSIQGPAEKVDFAVKKFGRTGLEMQKVLEMDTEEFRNMSAAIDDNLIMTEEQVKAARDLEIGLDNLGDSAQGVSIQIGNVMVSGLNKAFVAFDQLYQIATKYKDLLADHNQDIIGIAKTYAEYKDEMIRSAKAAGNYIDVNGNLRSSIGDLITAQLLLTEIEFKLANNLFDVADEGTRAANAMKGFADNKIAEELRIIQEKTENLPDSFARWGQSIDGVTKASERLVLSQAQIKTKFDLLSQAVEGKVGKSISEYNEKHQELNLEISTTGQRIEALSKLKVLTPEQQTNLNKYWSAMVIAKGATEDMVQTSSQNMPSALKKMNEALADVTDGPASFKTAAAAVKWYQDKVNGLSDGTYLTDAQKKELDELKEKLGTAKGAVSELDKEFQESSKRMLFSMLVTKASAGILTDTEVENLTKVALSWGLVDQATATTALQLNSLDLDDARFQLGSVDAILSHMNGLPRNYDYRITTTHSQVYMQSRTVAPGAQTTGRGGEQFASGGSFRIPDSYGYEGFGMGGMATASGGEGVTVTQKGKDIIDYDRLARAIRDSMMQVAG